MSTNRPSDDSSLPAPALSVKVAIDLDYESAGSFVTTFKKALRTSPGRYMAERQGATFSSLAV